MKRINLQGTIKIIGDKSITHRAIIIASISKGKSIIKNPNLGLDCLATLKAMRQLGVKYRIKANNIEISGVGLNRIRKPKHIINVGNSGTTIRLLTGLLAAQNFNSKITGDSSIRKRPMKRVITPLTLMGAEISAYKNNFAPLKIYGKPLHGIKYKMPISSAQVKSAILLASLYASGKTTIIEPIKSRDHTERMLQFAGRNNVIAGDSEAISSGLLCRRRLLAMTGIRKLNSVTFDIPEDISQAAFFIVAALIIPKSKIIIKNVGINPTRTGIIEVLKKMGAKIKIFNKKIQMNEPVGDIEVKYNQLHGINISGQIIPRLIDEIPILCVAAAFARGATTIKNIGELKFKESDRIKAITTNLRKLDLKVESGRDFIKIQGIRDTRYDKRFTLNASRLTLSSYGDHRIAMALVIAGLALKQKLKISNLDYIKTSYPDFLKDLRKIQRNICSKIRTLTLFL